MVASACPFDHSLQSINESESLIHAFDGAPLPTRLVAAAATGFASAAPTTTNKSLLLRGHWCSSFGFEELEHPRVLLRHDVKLVQALAERAVVGVAQAAEMCRAGSAVAAVIETRKAARSAVARFEFLAGRIIASLTGDSQ